MIICLQKLRGKEKIDQPDGEEEIFATAQIPGVYDR